MGNLEEEKTMQAPVCVTLLKIHKAIWKTKDQLIQKLINTLNLSIPLETDPLLEYRYILKANLFLCFFLSETSACDG